VVEAFTASAKRFAQGGFEVVVDGVVGPWFLEAWRHEPTVPGSWKRGGMSLRAKVP
jgi:hypothetical protein